MYERLRQRFRQIMAVKQFLSTVKYVAGTKPSFLLSEIAAYLDEPLTAGQMYEALRPHLCRARAYLYKRPVKTTRSRGCCHPLPIS